LEKKENGVRGPEKLGQNGPAISTAAQLAKEYGVSENTIKRDFFKAFNQIFNHRSFIINMKKMI